MAPCTVSLVGRRATLDVAGLRPVGRKLHSWEILRRVPFGQEVGGDDLNLCLGERATEGRHGRGGDSIGYGAPECGGIHEGEIDRVVHRPGGGHSSSSDGMAAGAM